MKQTPLVYQAYMGSMQDRCSEGLNELSFPVSNGWDVTGSHDRGIAEPHLSSPPCIRESISCIKKREVSRLKSRGQMNTMTIVFSKGLIQGPVKLPTIPVTRARKAPSLL